MSAWGKSWKQYANCKRKHSKPCCIRDWLEVKEVWENTPKPANVPLFEYPQLTTKANHTTPAPCPGVDVLAIRDMVTSSVFEEKLHCALQGQWTKILASSLPRLHWKFLKSNLYSIYLLSFSFQLPFFSFSDHYHHG